MGIPETKPTRLPAKALFWYSLPMVSGGLMSFLVGNYLMKYATDILLIAPGVMGFIFFVSRLWDAINDPLCGYFSDRTQAKMGRRSIWILASSLPIVLAFYALWNIPSFANVWYTNLWMAIAVILFFTFLTALYVPHYALGAELSQDYHEKNRIFGIRAIAENIGNFLGVIVIAVLASASMVRQRSLWMFALLAMLSMLLIILMVMNLRGFDQPRPSQRPVSNAFTNFAALLHNPHARIIYIVGFFSQLGAAIVLNMALYYAHYILKNEQAGTIMIALFMIAATLAIPFWIVVAKRYSKKQLWLFAKLMLGLGFASTLLLDAEHIYWFYALSAVLGSCAGAVLIIHPSLLSDAIDYDESMSHERKEGSYFSMFTLINKSAMALAAFIIGLILQFTGFTPNTEQSQLAALGIRLGYGLLPMLSFFIGAVALLFYRFSEEEHRQLVAKMMVWRNK